MNKADGFTILKVSDDYYKVFITSKRGMSSEWRISSGGKLEDLNFKDKTWTQVSGSTYSVEGEEFYCDRYQRSILNQCLDAGAEIVTLESLR